MKLKVALLLSITGGLLMAQDLDLLIRNGKIVDGTGNPSFHADLGIKAGKIAAVGTLTKQKAARTIDAKGLVVAPGFIDMHNHSDDAILSDGNAESMIRQGVTSMILGEGSSAAPTSQFPRFRDYWAAVLKGGVSTNIGSYVGSDLLFHYAHGADEVHANESEQAQSRVL